MIGTHENQALLAVIREDGNHIVIRTLGRGVESEVNDLGTDLSELGLGCPDQNEPPGLYVWSGRLVIPETWNAPAAWHGTWRPARVGDLERFGLRGLEPAVPPQQGSIIEALAEARKASGNAWDRVEDPEKFLAEARGENDRLKAELAILRDSLMEPAQPTDDHAERVTVIRYRNHRGETADRHIIPLSIGFGATEWHPQRQWLLRAWDLDKRAYRDFAMADIQEWRQGSAVEAGGSAVGGEEGGDA